MKKVIVLVEIKVDEDNIKNLYPNFNYNWDDVDEFIESRINDIETPLENNEKFGDYLKEYGYSIRVLSREEGKLLNVE